MPLETGLSLATVANPFRSRRQSAGRRDFVTRRLTVFLPLLEAVT